MSNHSAPVRLAGLSSSERTPNTAIDRMFLSDSVYTLLCHIRLLACVRGFLHTTTSTISLATSPNHSYRLDLKSQTSSISIDTSLITSLLSFSDRPMDLQILSTLPYKRLRSHRSRAHVPNSSSCAVHQRQKRPVTAASGSPAAQKIHWL